MTEQPVSPDGDDERAAFSRADFPPVVYAPTTAVPDDDGLAHLEMLQLADGRVALFVYSAVDRLHAWWGEGAPWVLLSVEHLQRAYEAVPYDLLLLDRRPLREGAAPDGSAD